MSQTDALTKILNQNSKSEIIVNRRNEIIHFLWDTLYFHHLLLYPIAFTYILVDLYLLLCSNNFTYFRASIPSPFIVHQYFHLLLSINSTFTFYCAPIVLSHFILHQYLHLLLCTNTTFTFYCAPIPLPFIVHQ